MLISSVIVLVIVSMNYAFAELITNPQTIFSSSVHYIYPKGKYLWRISVMLRFQFLIEMKNACYTLFFGTDNLSVVKNLSMVSAAIDYILVLAGKFNVPLFITEIQESKNPRIPQQNANIYMFFSK